MDKPRVTKTTDGLWRVFATIQSRERNLTLSFPAATWEQALRLANDFS